MANVPVYWSSDAILVELIASRYRVLCRGRYAFHWDHLLK
jgi:hypothetical protein